MLFHHQFQLALVWLYLDPGSGSFLLQMLMAAILGIGVGVKIYWRKIKSFFGGKSAEQNSLDDTDEE